MSEILSGQSENVPDPFDGDAAYWKKLTFSPASRDAMKNPKWRSLEPPERTCDEASVSFAQSDTPAPESAPPTVAGNGPAQMAEAYSDVPASPENTPIPETGEPAPRVASQIGELTDAAASSMFAETGATALRGMTNVQA